MLPVILSAAGVTTNVPTGTVIVIVVPLGLVITFAVVPLTLPVIVSPIVKFAEAATVNVITPKGYSLIAEVVDSCAIFCVTSSTTHKFNPRLAQSENKRFKERLALLESYPVRNSNPQRS